MQHNFNDLMANVMKKNIIINADIEQVVLKKLLDHCFYDKIKETVSHSVLNDLYSVAFELPDDILMERINIKWVLMKCEKKKPKK